MSTCGVSVYVLQRSLISGKLIIRCTVTLPIPPPTYPALGSNSKKIIAVILQLQKGKVISVFTHQLKRRGREKKAQTNTRKIQELDSIEDQVRRVISTFFSLKRIYRHYRNMPKHPEKSLWAMILSLSMVFLHFFKFSAFLLSGTFYQYLPELSSTDKTRWKSLVRPELARKLNRTKSDLHHTGISEMECTGRYGMVLTTYGLVDFYQIAIRIYQTF